MIHTMTMIQDKQCKHSVRYAVDPRTITDPGAQPIDTIYVSRSAFNPMPQILTVIIHNEPQIGTK